MLRIAIDTQIIDAIADAPGLLTRVHQAYAKDKLVFVLTHVQSDELSEITNADHRGRLLAVFNALPSEWVPTDGFVIGYSRLDMARLGDGSWTGVSLNEIDSEDWNHRRDALIGTTAAGNADILVTNDRRLARRMRATDAPCRIWTMVDLVAFLDSLDDD